MIAASARPGPRIAYVLPTRDRPETLARTVAALERLPRHDAQVVVVDNASSVPPRLPVELHNGLPVTLLHRDRNEGAAARNAGALASDPSCDWLVMLDDDSHPLSIGVLDALREAPADAGAVQAEILLPAAAGRARHEAGGLPEVFIGCGVAIRRRAFIDAGGYDPSFNYYAEEYDLAAKLLLAGWRVTIDRRFVVMHEKTGAGRDMNLILRRLVRNNTWVMLRYAPRGERGAEIRRTIARYGRIALKERAETGYAAGLLDLARTALRQPRREMPRLLWERFIGLDAARRALENAGPIRLAALLAPGKNEHVVRAALMERGVRVVGDPDSADALVIGTLSPGPALDALAAHAARADGPRVIAPLSFRAPASLAAAA
ncbi:MAG: glycosyltransferase [Phycisphaeraceae bacterium]|nr:glycosyltransferase [Phycisphaeraceae bacterium]